MNASITKLTLLLINVCGLKSKLKSIDFEEYIQPYDLIFLTETKLDDLDEININGFDIIYKNRKGAKRASGGIAVLINNQNEISNHFEIFNKDDSDIIWLKIKESYVGKELAFCLTYVPPENSRYTDVSIFDRIEESVTDYLGQNEDNEVCVLGDFNARTGLLSDLPENIVDTVDTDDMASMYFSVQPREPRRKSQDETINNYGNRLIQMCLSQGLYIANGRCGPDMEGKTTCKNTSLIDYVLTTPDLLNQMIFF